MGLGALICGRRRRDLLRRVKPRPSMVVGWGGMGREGRRGGGEEVGGRWWMEEMEETGVYQRATKYTMVLWYHHFTI